MLIGRLTSGTAYTPGRLLFNARKTNGLRHGYGANLEYEKKNDLKPYNTYGILPKNERLSFAPNALKRLGRRSAMCNARSRNAKR